VIQNVNESILLEIIGVKIHRAISLDPFRSQEKAFYSAHVVVSISVNSREAWAEN